ncbi:Crp/Fnr family transcriptional regulator [Listeria costaricensis]|uniref:Crp/Fnr family transcriptional regulator n=1 Tax=Listeria costaricensis TaxID=2026604 RepID=UPI000C08ABA8|nr:Crp/Fnr family transcriptional regulator [Listeria costaricensis]
MLFLKELETNLTVNKLMEQCFEHPNYKDYCSIISTKKGTVLENTNLESEKIYFILNGIYGMTVKQANESEDDEKECIIRFLQKGDSFGLYFMYYDCWEPGVSLQSLGRGEVMAVDSNFLFSILDEWDENNFFMIRCLSEELRETQCFTQLSFLKKEERIRKALLKCAQSLGTYSDNGILLPKEITQEVLARYTNTSREYVAHTIMKLIKEDIVRNRPKPLLILDKHRL